MPKDDAELLLKAEHIFNKTRRRYGTYVRGIVRENNKPGAAQTRVALPASWLFEKMYPDTFSKNLNAKRRQELAVIEKMPIAKRRRFHVFLGVFFSRWTGQQVTVYDAFSYVESGQKAQESFQFDVRPTGR